MRLRCLGCGSPVGAEGAPGSEASISGGIMGDGYTESWFLCGACDAYTVEVYRDRFLGEGTSSLRGPVARAEGDAQVRLIRQCAEPWDERCRCAAHRAYFGGALD